MPGPHVCLFHRNRLFSECLAAALVESPGCDCSILLAESFDEHSVSRLGGVSIDLLLLDATLDLDSSGMLANRMRHLYPGCKVILLIAEQAVHRMLELAQFGSHGCLFEGVGLADVRLAIQAVLAGQPYCSPQLANALMTQVGRGDRGREMSPLWDDAHLTSREREILELIACEQLGNKQIARHLGLSLYTVKNHVHNLIEKLGVQDRHEAVQFARRRGFLVGDRTTPSIRDAVRSPH